MSFVVAVGLNFCSAAVERDGREVTGSVASRSKAQCFQ